MSKTGAGFLFLVVPRGATTIGTGTARVSRARISTIAIACAIGGCVSEPPPQPKPKPSVQVVTPPPPTPNPHGKWVAVVGTSRVDDSKTVTLTLDANETINGWPSKVVRPKLVLRCQEHRTDAYIETGMAADIEHGVDGATVTLRFDRSKAFSIEAGRSTDNEALFLPNAVARIRQMAQGDRLLFRFTPYNSSPQETTFELTGLSAAIAPLEEACGWKVVTPTPAPPKAITRAVIDGLAIGTAFEDVKRQIGPQTEDLTNPGWIMMYVWRRPSDVKVTLTFTEGKLSDKKIEGPLK